MSKPELKVWMRHESKDRALATARKLVARYGPRFAVIFDDMGLPGFVYPFAVVGLPL